MSKMKEFIVSVFIIMLLLLLISGFAYAVIANQMQKEEALKAYSELAWNNNQRTDELRNDILNEINILEDKITEIEKVVEHEPNAELEMKLNDLIYAINQINRKFSDGINNLEDELEDDIDDLEDDLKKIDKRLLLVESSILY